MLWELSQMEYVVVPQKNMRTVFPYERYAFRKVSAILVPGPHEGITEYVAQTDYLIALLDRKSVV